MQSVTVKENGKVVFIRNLGYSQILYETKESYSGFSDYFNELLEVSRKIVGDADLNFVLNVDSHVTLMTLLLTEEEYDLAKQIKEALLIHFKDDIEQIGIEGNTLNILDFFYEFN